MLPMVRLSSAVISARPRHVPRGWTYSLESGVEETGVLLIDDTDRLQLGFPIGSFIMCHYPLSTGRRYFALIPSILNDRRRLRYSRRDMTVHYGCTASS